MQNTINHTSSENVGSGDVCDSIIDYVWGILSQQKTFHIHNLISHEIHVDTRFSLVMLWCCRIPVYCSHILRYHGPLAKYVKLRVAHAPGIPGTFYPPPRVRDPGMYHGTCVTNVPWCMPGSLASGFLWSRWRGKRCRHSRRMRNSQFYVSGKRPMESLRSSLVQMYNPGPLFTSKTDVGTPINPRSP